MSMIPTGQFSLEMVTNSGGGGGVLLSSWWSIVCLDTYILVISTHFAVPTSKTRNSQLVSSRRSGYWNGS